MSTVKEFIPDSTRMYINGQHIDQYSDKKFMKAFRLFLSDKEVLDSYDIDSMGHKQLHISLCRQFDVSIDSKLSRNKTFKLFKLIYIANLIDGEIIGICMARVEAMHKKQKENKKSRKRIVNEKPELDYEHKLVLGNAINFYLTDEWKRLRYRVFDLHGNHCMCCGRGRSDGIVLHVDHIKPRLLRPDLSLEINNLQILCHLCNEGKRADYITDWR